MPRKRVRVTKIKVGLARLSNCWILDRDTVGALNIGLRALSSGRRPVALALTIPYAALARLVNLRLGRVNPTEMTPPCP